MCMKKVLKYTLNDGKEIETITRDCAQQKKIEQVLLLLLENYFEL